MNLKHVIKYLFFLPTVLNSSQGTYDKKVSWDNPKTEHITLVLGLSASQKWDFPWHLQVYLATFPTATHSRLNVDYYKFLFHRDWTLMIKLMFIPSCGYLMRHCITLSSCNGMILWYFYFTSLAIVFYLQAFCKNKTAARSRLNIMTIFLYYGCLFYRWKHTVFIHIGSLFVKWWQFCTFITQLLIHKIINWTPKTFVKISVMEDIVQSLTRKQQDRQ